MATLQARIFECVVDVLRDPVQDRNAEPIDQQTDPSRGLDFESDDGLDFAWKISERLGFPFLDDQNPLIDDGGRRPCRVGEIVNRIASAMAEAKETHRG